MARAPRKVIAGGMAVIIGLLMIATASRWVRRGASPGLLPLAIEPPRRPMGGETVSAGTALQPLLDAAPAGSVFCLSPGDYAGPIVVRHPLTLWGPRTAVVRSPGTGITVDVRSDNVALLGFTIDGSGDRFDLMESAVHVRGAKVRVEGLRVINALFGLVAEESREISFIGNVIVGDASSPVGLRGDGIRLWETRDSLVAQNRLEHSRDIVVWYSPGNRILGNEVRHSRYGTHFMYSSEAVIERNRYIENVVGVFIMYSHDMQLRENVLAENAAEGMGLGVKESGNLSVENNRFIKSTAGVYLDNSPYRRGDANTFRQNLFDLCESGVVFHSSETGNTFEDNTFRDNQIQVQVEGRGNALKVTWRGNYFDDYRGYDLDRDGFGDLPYELRSLSDQLMGGKPELSFFRGTLALELVDTAGRVFPLFQPSPILVDPGPRMSATAVLQ